MKNIFKKNQIIITALAIMIAIAGYLSFTNNDKPEDVDTVETANPDSDDYDVFTELDGMEVVTDTTTDDTTDTTTDDTTDTTDDTDTDTTDTTTDDTNDETTTLDDEEDTTPVDTESEADELGDISDEDLLETAQNVADNGELVPEDGVPGEAVLANAALDASYFISQKIDREQVRSENRATFMEIIGSPDISEEAKKDALQGMIDSTEIAKKENATETLLEAKGFDGAVVLIVDGKVDVVVNSANLSDQQLAIIEDVVKRKTDIAAKNIAITPVIVGE